ncbi:MAG TPA: alpha-ketoglutarate-dependent dioxygenase AlkB [Gammaproteobacteria bacterium]|nr:alpha-ketoglutarate-dependent dioxygenase AlkB [Gammaproteobacteria bacterium]
MNLIDFDPSLNILPCDGEASYFGSILSHRDTDYYLEHLLDSIRWENDQVLIYGKRIITKRKVAWYGDSDYAYTYSNVTKHALGWTRELTDLKDIVEDITDTDFNSCLLNLYHDGDEGVGWHSDDETALGENPIIASLTFGAERKFSLKHKVNKQVVSLTLESGSLFVMKGKTQSNWVHCLPKMKGISTARINLTFRRYR